MWKPKNSGWFKWRLDDSSSASSGGQQLFFPRARATSQFHFHLHRMGTMVVLTPSMAPEIREIRSGRLLLPSLSWSKRISTTGELCKYSWYLSPKIPFWIPKVWESPIDPIASLDIIRVMWPHRCWAALALWRLERRRDTPAGLGRSQGSRSSLQNASGHRRFQHPQFAHLWIPSMAAWANDRTQGSMVRRSSPKLWKVKKKCAVHCKNSPTLRRKLLLLSSGPHVVPPAKHLRLEARSGGRFEMHKPFSMAASETKTAFTLSPITVGWF